MRRKNIPTTRRDRDWFRRFLLDPDQALWRRTAFLFYLLHADKALSETDAAKRWRTEVLDWLPTWFSEGVEEKVSVPVFGRHAYEDTGLMIRSWFAVEQGSVNTGDAFGMHCGHRLEDGAEQQGASGYEGAWNGFLRLFNLMQFVPNACVVTASGMAAHRYDTLLPVAERPGAAPAGAAPAAGWLKEALELADPALLDTLPVLAEAAWPAPVAGYALTDPAGGSRGPG